ncbi:MAG: DUF2949 domain-containing protein [Thermostichus sp. HHBFW_bins_43]
MMPPHILSLLNALQTELGIPEAAIAFVLKRQTREQGPLPILLWRYGLISLEQLVPVLEWCAGFETPIPASSPWRSDP